MSKHWEYQSAFYCTRDLGLDGGADGRMTYDGNVHNWEAYAVVNSLVSKPPGSEPWAGFRVFSRRPSTKPLVHFY